MRYPLNFLPCFRFLLSVYGKGILLTFFIREIGGGCTENPSIIRFYLKDL